MIQLPPDAAAAPPAGWVVSRRRGPASGLVDTGLDPAGGAAREVRVCEPTTAAFVLGSTQPASDVDADRAASARVEVCRRRSGGGGVLVVPGAQLWLDVFVPAGDTLFTPDVGRAFRWLGFAAAQAVGAVAGVDPRVHDGGLVQSPWSSVLCFAGLGPGEVCAGGRKVVGISQRRDRRGAWFHAMLLLRHVPEQSAAVLARDESERASATECLRVAAGAVDADPTRLERALVEAITAA